MKDLPDKWYAVYSETAARQFGTCVWARADGTEVEVTGVYDRPNHPNYAWPDAQWRGEVVRWVRFGLPKRPGLYGL